MGPYCDICGKRCFELKGLELVPTCTKYVLTEVLDSLTDALQKLRRVEPDSTALVNLEATVTSLIRHMSAMGMETGA